MGKITADFLIFSNVKSALRLAHLIEQTGRHAVFKNVRYITQSCTNVRVSEIVPVYAMKESRYAGLVTLILQLVTRM